MKSLNKSNEHANNKKKETKMARITYLLPPVEEEGDGPGLFIGDLEALRCSPSSVDRMEETAVDTVVDRDDSSRAFNCEVAVPSALFARGGETGPSEDDAIEFDFEEVDARLRSALRLRVLIAFLTS